MTIWLARVLAKANLADTILKVFCAADDFDFDAHEVNRKIAAIKFWESHSIFLGSDDHLGVAFFGAIDGIENFLLRESMMVGESFAVGDFRPKLDEAFLKTFRLSDCAECGDFFASEKIQRLSIICIEGVLKIERVVDAFNDSSLWIMLDDQFAERSGLTIALGDENGGGALDMGNRLSKCAARKQMPVAEWQLAIDENDVVSTPS